MALMIMALATPSVRIAEFRMRLGTEEKNGPVLNVIKQFKGKGFRWSLRKKTL